ncbi:MAG TPA: glycosyltransferase [Rudaea sp.]|nr:glycosyltransferase [Rudaea sp.]
MAEAPIRVLHLGKFFPPHPGGIERFVSDLTAAQATQGLTVRVLAHAEPGSWRSRHFRAGDVDVDLAACHGQFVYAPVSPAFPRLLARAIREFKPDVLHIHVPNTSAFWALLSPAARRIPWIVHWHADIPLDSRRRALRFAYRLYKPWEQALLRHARVVIATSRAYADSSAALAPWQDKVRVVPLGLPETITSDAATSTNIQWPAPGLRLLGVGRLSYFKGFDVLLRAFAQVPEASLVLIGGGECADSLRALAAQLRIETRVHFAGRLDMDAAGQALLESAYTNADVFCLPSTERAESFGLVLLEAMRAGKPVIASDIPGSGVGFVVRDGETGMLVPPNDADALAAALRRLAADANLRQRFGEAGQRRFQREFTLDRIVPQVMDAYLESAVRMTAS